VSNLISSSRGADKYTSIANEIRRRIATGQFSPGSQLPQRTALEEDFQVSKVTLQRAMNLLIEDGFIDVMRRKGSFVAERPPHLSRYALVFQGRPDPRSHLSQFWVALANEAARHERQTQNSIPIYHGINGHVDTEDFQKLSGEIHEHRLAGLIYVPDYSFPPDLSVIGDSALPCVMLHYEENDLAPTIVASQESFMLRALDYVAAQGCRRVAFLRHGGDDDASYPYLPDALAERGLETRPFWTQGVSIRLPQSARNCMHLLMQPGQNEWPDALIINDDNLVEFATLGLVDAGVKPSGDMVVVAHANFPWKTQSYVEVQRLGYDIQQILAACIENIDCQRRNQEVPAVTQIPALFEQELRT